MSVGVADDLALGRDPAAQRLEECVAAVPLEAGEANQLARLDLEVDRPAVRTQLQPRVASRFPRADEQHLGVR